MFKRLIRRFKDILGINEIFIVKEILLESYLLHKLEMPRYRDGKKLNKYEYRVFSQYGEDGIIQEIFNRIGVTNNFFVEIGAGDGLENNTLHLLFNNWQGVWIEAEQKNINLIRTHYQNQISSGKLNIQDTFVNAENIEKVLKKAKVPIKLDLLSIDIDGNDYWIWNAITNYRPRVLIIEYNASWGPHTEWIMPYNPNHVTDRTMYFGASLKALQKLAEQKGYRLVGTTLSGVNSFFVRKDLVKNKFHKPFTSIEHFEPPRYSLLKKSGHPATYRIIDDYQS